MTRPSSRFAGIMSIHRRPELDIICLCARTEIGKKRAEAIARLAEKQIDWSYVHTVALQHRVIPLLYRALSSTCPDAVPKHILEQFRVQFYTNAARNLLLAQKLIEILRLLESHEIRAIPFKGPTLAISIYGNLALRQFGDLDILVPKPDYERARQLVIKQGFHATIEHEWETELTDEGGTIAVDLHKRITAREFSCPLTFEYLSRRLESIPLAGTVVSCLCPEDTLLMLSIQLTKDRSPQLAKVCDVAEVIRAHADLNWEGALRQAKNIGGERLMLFAMCVTHELLGASLPPGATKELPRHRAIHRLVNHTAQEMFSPSEQAAPDQLPPQRFHSLARERFRDKLYPYYLRYVEDVIAPCQLDQEFLRLPRKLYLVYYLLRPIRLIGKYGSLLLRRMVHLSSAVERL